MKKIIMKTLKKTKEGIFVLVSDYGKSKKTSTLFGNIPYIPNGTVIDLTIEDDRITDYEYIFSKRNKSLLEKEEIDSEEFSYKVNAHKMLNQISKEHNGGPVYWDDVLTSMENPYMFLPFSMADEVAFEKGMDKLCSERISTLAENTKKAFRARRKTVYHIDEYVDEFKRQEEAGSFDKIEIANIIESIKPLLFVVDNKTGECIINDRELKEADDFIKKRIKFLSKSSYELCKRDKIEEYLKKVDYLAPEQREAVEGLVDNAFCVVTGGAGNGKTTVIKEIINAYEYCGHSRNNICLAAPTGKAAVRMSQACGFEAKTIDCALRRSREDDFVYYKENNLMPFGLYIIDESSMIDTLLMKDFLAAVPKEAKIYFVGDCNQLPPVGCGQPYFDFIIDYPQNAVKLTKNFRQGEDNTIYINGKRILDDEPLISGDNFAIFHIKKDDIEDIISQKIDESYLTDKNQIIAPTNELVDMINKKMAVKFFGTSNFAKGNKVLFLKNTKDYYNGDTGIITTLYEGGIDVCVNEKVIYIAKKDFDKINPGFAITTHKSQGSEYNETIFFLPQKKSSFITKRLVYTGITRGKKKVNLYLYEE